MNLKTGIFSVLTFGSVFLISACQSTGIHQISDKNFHRVSSGPAEVSVFMDSPASSFTEIAWVDSFVHIRKSESVRADQLRDLQEKAHSVGADAVIKVSQLTEQRDGMIADPTIPWHAWKQGDYELYFLRGVAVRLSDDQAEWEETWSENPEVIVSASRNAKHSRRENNELDLDSINVVTIEENPSIQQPFTGY